MPSELNHNHSPARLPWAIATPFLLALSAAALPLTPAFCVYLDDKSRTWTGAVTLAVASVALTVLFGLPAAAVCAFVLAATAGAYAMMRTKLPFSTRLVAAAGGGVLGAVAMLGLLGASAGKALDEITATWAYQALAGIRMPADYPAPLDILAYQLQMLQQGQGGFQLILTVPQSVVDMTSQEKYNLVYPALEAMFAAYIPALSLAGGMLVGGLGFYLPAFARRVRLGNLRDDAEAAPDDGVAPPFAAFKMPKYIVITLLLLQLVSQIWLSGGAMDAVAVSALLLFNLLMSMQALSFLSFLLNRKKVVAVLQVVILAPTALLFSWALPMLGFFDAIFDMRAVIARVDALKAKGRKVFTQGGLDELRKMDQNRKNDKNGGNGEGGKQ